jgi:16S rRNA (guanine527-N7)-methyltransferase
MLTNEQSKLLTEGAQQLQVELTAESIDRIAVYLEELQRWAKIVDLVSQSDLETIIRKHVLDSLAVLSVLPVQGRLLDLGSGAGLPGLPIAVTKPTLEVSLLEQRRKRVNFLKEVIRKANLTNAKAYEGRVEEFANREGWNSAFDIVITRATWNIQEFLNLARPFVVKNGMVVAMIGATTAEELKEENFFPQKHQYFLREFKRYNLPFGTEQRVLAIFSLA